MGPSREKDAVNLAEAIHRDMSANRELSVKSTQLDREMWNAVAEGRDEMIMCAVLAEGPGAVPRWLADRLRTPMSAQRGLRPTSSEATHALP